MTEIKTESIPLGVEARYWKDKWIEAQKQIEALMALLQEKK